MNPSNIQHYKQCPMTTTFPERPHVSSRCPAVDRRTSIVPPSYQHKQNYTHSQPNTIPTVCSLRAPSLSCPTPSPTQYPHTHPPRLPPIDTPLTAPSPPNFLFVLFPLADLGGGGGKSTNCVSGFVLLRARNCGSLPAALSIW